MDHRQLPYDTRRKIVTISDELKRIVDQLNRQGKMRFLEAATEEDIAAFERKYGVRLPEKYKEWLQVSDGGDLFLPAGIQLYGVAHKPIIDVDYDDRPGENYVVIGALSMGDPIVFEKTKEQISIYNHESDCIEEDETYTDFFALLNDLYELLGIGG